MKAAVSEPRRIRRGILALVGLGLSSMLTLGVLIASASTGRGASPAFEAIRDPLTEAKVAFAEGDWPAAEKLLRSLIGIEARTLLGRVLLERGACEEAARLFGEVLREDGNTFEAIRGMALATQRLGRPQAAAVYFMRAAELRKDDPRAWRELGLCQQSAGDTIAAITSIQQSLKLAPSQRDLSSLMGDLTRGAADPALASPGAWRVPGAEQTPSRPLDPSNLVPQSRFPAAASNPLRLPGRNR